MIALLVLLKSGRMQRLSWPQQCGGMRSAGSSGVASTSASSCAPRYSSSRRTAVQVQAQLLHLSASENKKSVERLKKLRLITAVKTPYLANGKFDLPSYDRIIEDQIKHGVEGVIVGGTTGEGQLMSWDEVRLQYRWCNQGS